MTGDAAPRSPDPRLWGRLRSLIILGLALLVAYLAAQDAFGTIRRGQETAVFDPGAADQSQFASATIDNWAEGDPRRYASPAVRRWAEQALRADPLNAAALRIYGFAAGSSGDEARGTKAIELAGRLTRREPRTQLWLIEQQSSRGDVAATLAHYDILLRTSLRMRPLLFDTLSRALAEPTIRKAFAGYVTRPPAWLEPFVVYVIDYAKQREPLALALEEAGGLPDTPEFRTLETRFLQALVASGDVEAGRRFLLTMAGARPAIFKEPGFTADTTEQRFSPLAWRIAESPTIITMLEPIGSDGRLAARIQVNPASRGLALQRYFFLRPGAHRIEAVTDPATSGTPDLQWTVRCQLSGSPFQTWTGATGRFEVPPNCPYQIIDLNVAAGEVQNPMEVVLRDLRIGDAALPPR